MTRMQKLIVLFWVIIGGMLIWQFSSYNSGVVQKSIDHPKPQNYFFDGQAQSGAVAPSLRAANVQQVSFSIENDTPGPGNFTAHVTVKNVGNAKAVGVQVRIRPYRGGNVYANEQWTVDDPPIHPVSEQDPLAQFGQWIEFPNLAPGDTATQSAVFINQPRVQPGNNSHPQITFETEKATP